MKKLVLWLPVLFLCILTGCVVKEAAVTVHEASQEVVVLWDGKEETYDWVYEIGKKIKIKEIVFSNESEGMEKEIETADLVIAGVYGTRDNLSNMIKLFKEWEGMKGKRCSYFWVQEKGSDPDEWEPWDDQTEKEMVCLPGISLREEREYFEEELLRVDGWITSVFTLKKEKGS